MVAVTVESLDRLVSIARAAGAAVLEGYGGAAGPADLKADGSPVTAADRAAHRVIVAELERFAPGVPVISEEGEIPDAADRASWATFWLVDPLDGTKEFIARNGEFTVNIALVAGGEPVLGVVHAPALGLTYAAGKGLGAWKEGPDPGGARLRIHSEPPSPGKPLTVVESRSHPSAELEAYLRTVPVGRRVRIGSSLKLCLVAEGAADIYPRLGPTMAWDVAAGDCIYRCSGRTGERRSPIRYDTRGLRNEGFVLGAE